MDSNGLVSALLCNHIHTVFKNLRGVLAVVAAGVILTAPVYADTVHVAEDGMTYILDGGDVNAAAPEQEDWTQGKIESILLEEMGTSAQLDVIVYVQRGAAVNEGAGVSVPISEIKSQHIEAIKQTSEQLRKVHRIYKPDWSMDEFEERQHMEVVELAMSEQDRAEIQRLKGVIDDQKNAMRSQVSAEINRLSDNNLQTIHDLIVSSGGTVTVRLKMTNALGAQIPAALLTTLAQHPMVRQVLKNRPTDFELDVSVPSMQYNAWWNDAVPIIGTPFDFGVIDSGVVEGHPAFSCVNTFESRAGSSVLRSHGTHVTGIAVSCDTTYQGGIQDVDKVIWTNSGGAAGQAGTMDNMDWMVTTPVDTPEVINHSLGYGTANVDDYNDNDSFYDALIDLYDLMVTKSAGNGGWGDVGGNCSRSPYPASPCITHPAPAFNLMAVANIDDLGTTSRTSDVRSSSSSTGPTVNGRKKPDITAPGTDIMSTFSEWNGATGAILNCGDGVVGNPDFVDCSGTSMAAPHVAAAIVLMEDGGNNIPMAQKAVLINTADAWDSNDTLTTADDGSVTGSHWDMSYGWGYMDMWEAHFNKDDYFTGSVIGSNDNNTPDDYKLYKGTMFINEKATLTWHKRASTYVAGGPSTGRYALTDINIRLYDEIDGAQESQDLDGDDNVHQVAATDSSTKVIKVYAWSTSIGGLTAEPYALATEENFTTALPPSFTRNYSRPNYVGPNQVFDITARIFNNGDVAAHSNTMTLTNITGAAVVGDNAVTLPSITSGGGVQEHVYTIDTSGIAAGTHWFPLSVTSNSYAETYSRSWPGIGTDGGVSIIVETTAPTSDCTSATYDNTSPITVNWTASDTQTGVQRTYLYALTPGSASYLYTGLSNTGTSGSFNYVPSLQGQYRFAMRSVDLGGNWESIPAAPECATFYDSVNPSSTLSTPTYDTGGSITLTFTVTDPSPSSGLEFVDFWYRKDGGAWTYTGQSSTSLAGNVFFVPPGDGRYDFTSRAKDNSQNLECNIALGQCPVKSSTVYDTLPPTGSIIINGGASLTGSLSVTLGLNATDLASGVSLMRFSNDGATWSPWQAYATSTAWNLSSYGGNTSQGVKTVYAQYRDVVGWVSASYTDTIEYALDSDRDGVIDRKDNCTLVSNPAQRDTDGDRYGNYCDPDFNGDLIVNAGDLGYLKTKFFTPDPHADLNGDGIVNAGDLAILKSFFFKPPGPSGLVP